MPYRPENIVGEILGVRAVSGVNPAKSNFKCPFIGERCPKRSTAYPDEPYPVCSIWRGNKETLNPSDDLICVCPKRFHAVDFLKDVVAHCWPGPPPENPQIAPEVKMTEFGNVDFVIADILAGGGVGQFLSVELQAIDITGSVTKAYEALRRGVQLD